MPSESLPQSTREELLAIIEAQAKKIVELTERVAELERRLNLNSSNSSKPPSSEGLKKPPRVRSLREPSKRKPGGQEGHKGETLCQVAEPDHIVDHHPTTCSNCGEELTPEMSQTHVARQVFDLPEPQPLEVTEHRAHACQCAHCASVTQADFPEGVTAPVQYGARITAFIVYLLHWHMLPQDRLSTLMADLFSVNICAATIANMSRSCARRINEFVEAVCGLVADAPVKHMDETGFRIGGKTQWLHVACNAMLTFYRVCAKRGKMLSDIIEVTGVVVHDHWKPYYTMANVKHALCNAHHLRELKALVDIEKEDWARRMQIMLRRACHAVNLAKERDIGLKPQLIALFERRYDAITNEGVVFHNNLPSLQGAEPPQGQKKRGRKQRRTGHNLLIRLITRKEDTLRFLHDPAVPFTNNEAERGVRMMKLRQKISGGFRSINGATEFAAIRTFLDTARKQGWDIIASLTADCSSLVKALRTS